MTPTNDHLAAVEEMVRKSPTLALLEAVLRPLKKQRDELNRACETDPENEKQEYAADLFEHVYKLCAREARRRGYGLDMTPEKLT